MSLNLTTDIVLDVANARNPLRYAKVLHKLSQKDVRVETRTEHKLEFGEVQVDRMNWSSESAIDTRPTSDNLPLATNAPDSKHRELIAFKELETAFLRQAFDAILPKSSFSGNAGRSSGSHWRSVAIDTMAQAISSSGQIGISQSFSRSYGKRTI